MYSPYLIPLDPCIPFEPKVLRWGSVLRVFGIPRECPEGSFVALAEAGCVSDSLGLSGLGQELPFAYCSAKVSGLRAIR